MEIRFSARDYEAANGRAPRGRGAWAFRVVGIDGYLWESGAYMLPTAPLSVAKRLATAWARGYVGEVRPNAKRVVVEVLP